MGVREWDGLIPLPNDLASDEVEGSGLVNTAHVFISHARNYGSPGGWFPGAIRQQTEQWFEQHRVSCRKHPRLEKNTDSQS